MERDNSYAYTHTNAHSLVIAIFSYLLFVYKGIGVKAKVMQQNSCSIMMVDSNKELCLSVS